MNIQKPSHRPQVALDAINRLELKWWNLHADLIKKVWEMNLDISQMIRRIYLKDASLFLNKGKKNLITVVEPGCGSGWVGQSIQDKMTRIVGYDFSEAQISLAKKSVKGSQHQDNFSYFVADTIRKVPVESFDGAIIHAFLHHLDEREILKFFNEMISKLMPDSRVWIYEPVFFREKGTRDKLDSTNSDRLFGIACYVSAKLAKFLINLNLIDKDTHYEFNKVMQESSDKGWYLSPKEVPFDINEFTQFLSLRFVHVTFRWTTVYLVGWTFYINLIKNKWIRKIISFIYIPFFQMIDNVICRDESFIRKQMVHPTYGFGVWKCKGLLN